MLHAVIMAGGAGTRFWPESRAATPKQLLDLVGERTMIQSTVDRIAGLASPEQTLIVTAERLVESIAAQLPQVARRSILGEPCKRDTAPCIGLAALHVSQRDPDAIMAVMPSDHVIRDQAAFVRAIRFAANLVEQSPGRIVTFGIVPTYPAASFGYIERGSRLASLAGASDLAAFQVKQFREKPKVDVAKQYVATGEFYWNAGIFVWRASTILAALAEHQPEMFARLQAIAAAFDTPAAAATLSAEFAKIKGVSIDYAVMEHADDIVVVEAPFDWDDVGSWQSIARLKGADANGNTIDVRHVGLGTTGTLVRASDGHLIATLGLKDCIVVHTPNATLVANKNDEESIRQLVKLIEEHGWQAYL